VLPRFPDAVRAVFPRTRVQRCIVHMVRRSRRFVTYKDLKETKFLLRTYGSTVRAGLKAVYTAAGEEAGCATLDGFGKTREAKYPLGFAELFTRPTLRNRRFLLNR
jgi:transposase-like protein